MWSTAVNDPSTFSEQSTDVAENILKYGQNYETVRVFSGEKYATIAGLYAINISTGKMVEFTLPEKKTSQYITVSTDKGWSVVSKDKATGEWHISFYEENGGDPTSTDTLRRDFDKCCISKFFKELAELSESIPARVQSSSAIKGLIPA